MKKWFSKPDSDATNNLGAPAQEPRGALVSNEKFCAECGMEYKKSDQKFCSMCGTPTSNLVVDQASALRHLSTVDPALANDVENLLEKIAVAQVFSEPDSSEMTNLGQLAYHEGDEKEAKKWWQLGADAGNSEAMLKLGSLAVQSGDEKEAKKWWQLGADAGNSDAMLSLGLLAYHEGDEKEAKKWWQLGADAGNSGAMNNLGSLAEESGDLKEVKKWFQLAADAGLSDAMLSLGVIARDEEDLKAAKKWFQLAADAGLSDAMFELGVIARDEEDLKAAKKWYRSAAAAGQSDAMFELGLIAHNEEDLKAAKKWYRSAAEAGQSDAMFELGVIAEDDGDLADAKKWYRSAAEAGHLIAIFNSGVIARDEEDFKAAKKWFQLAVDEAGGPDPMFELGLIAEDDGDLMDAKKWFQLATDAGHPAAKFRLAFLADYEGDLKDAYTATVEAPDWGSFRNFWSDSEIEINVVTSGFVDIEGGGISVSGKWLPNCDECFGFESCNICGRSPSNSISIRSGGGDGAYCVHEIWFDGIAVGVFIVFDGGDFVGNITEFIRQWVKGSLSVEDFFGQTNDFFYSYLDEIDPHEELLQIGKITTEGNPVYSSDEKTCGILVIGESGQGIDSDQSLVTINNIPTGDYRAFVFAKRIKENMNSLSPRALLVLHEETANQIGLKNGFSKKVDLRSENDLWNKASVFARIGDPLAEEVIFYNYLLSKLRHNFEVTKETIDENRAFDLYCELLSWSLLLSRYDDSDEFSGQQIQEFKGFQDMLGSIHQLRGQFGRTLRS